MVAAAGTRQDALAALDVHRPDVAVLDVRMPPTHTGEGIAAAVEARRRCPELGMLVLSAYVEQTFATELLVDGVGGLGYLLKERVGRVGEFLDAVHRVAAATPPSTRRSSRSCSPARGATRGSSGSAPASPTCLP